MRVRVLAALAAMILVAGVGGAGVGASSDAATTPAAPDPTATMRLAGASAASQWDPHNGRSDAVDYQYLSLVYDQLLYLDSGMNIVAGLATSYELADDKKSLTLVLRDDVTFHDGTPFDAAAVIANFEYAKAAENALTATLLNEATAFTAVDDYTVRVDFATDGSSWPLNLALKIGLGGMASPAALEDPETLATTPAGSGPYEMTEQTQDTASYEKVADYWDPELLARLPQHVDLLAIGDENARITALQSGQLDGTLLYAPVPNEASIVDGENILKWQATLSNRHIFSLMNENSEPLLADPNVRRALSMAIDRNALEEFTGATCVAAGQPFVEGNQGHDPDVSTDTGAHRFDPEQAVALLADAGVEDLTLSATVVNLGIFTQLATAVQDMLAGVGVTMEINLVEPALSQETWRSGDFDLNFGSSNSSPDPAQVIGSYYIRNETFNPFGGDPELATMNAAAAALPYGSPERDAAYQEISAYINETPPFLHYCHWPPAGYYSSRVLGMNDQGWAQLTSIWDVRNLAIAAA